MTYHSADSSILCRSSFQYSPGLKGMCMGIHGEKPSELRLRVTTNRKIVLVKAINISFIHLNFFLINLCCPNVKYFQSLWDYSL